MKIRHNIPLITLFLLLNVAPAHAQRHTISGTISDAATGEVLIGATIIAVTLDKGTASNSYGFYSLTLPKMDSLTVLYSFIGFKPQLKKIYLTEDVALDVSLSVLDTVLDGIVVSGERAAVDNVRQTRMSVVDVPVQAIERLPAILGEQDVLKVIQLLPGVQSGEEGTAGYHVRGGATDQNLVQLDEATVYNPSHLFGLFSTFNTAALNNVQLVTGGFPANYGGRLSSTLDITMKEGNRQEYMVHGGIGLLATQLTVEGPLAKNRSSFIVSGRRSYFDLLSRPFQKSKGDNNYYLYDLNVKLNHQFSVKDRVYLSVFTGRDNAEYISPSSLGYGIRFGNTTGTLRWNHIFGKKIFSNTSLIRNKYFIRVNSTQGEFFSQNYSGIEDVTLKSELQYFPSPVHNFRFGALATGHIFRSTGNEGRAPTGQKATVLDESAIPKRTSTEAALYVNDRWEISNKLGLNLGFRVPAFFNADTTYFKLEPRVSVKLGVSESASIKAVLYRDEPVCTSHPQYYSFGSNRYLGHVQ